MAFSGILPTLSLIQAEKQLTRALPKLARAAEQEDLVNAFKTHLEETQGQIERLDKLVESTPEVRIKRIKCLAMEGLIEEGQEVIDAIESGPVRDAGLIAAAQKVEHYEIATYGTLCALAEKLGYTKAKKLLGETLEEEKNTDNKLTLIAEQKVNAKAAA
ncbi:YciE/YciF ferroxidase family protein [Serratia sp. C2(2)]|uniref:YciE/YciF ferroxidase family protein n=1 Tax=Serratia sp. C2(2) TaxID=3117678 RepID=UPI002ED078D1|nr:ferritin-like domain-containing protein [Serratia sp. C2(2)]